MKRRLGLFAAAAAALFLFSGCSLAGIDELYSLPQAPKEYLQLQELIDEEIKAGSEYSAPTAGSLRQSVQLIDLDGDGSNEALAFLRNKDLQPEICVYRKNEGDYALAATIAGDGTAIGRVECADTDGDGISEILVSWEVSAELRLLKVYSLKDWKPSVLLTASCADFQLGDLDSNGKTDVIALNLESSGGMVDMYTISRNGNAAQKSVRLSASLKTADRFRIAEIAGGIPAVFIEGPYS
ncbi:MAG: VCBS repeat-containing protein, partial [Oscillospiraceae bacterium]